MGRMSVMLDCPKLSDWSWYIGIFKIYLVANFFQWLFISLSAVSFRHFFLGSTITFYSGTLFQLLIFQYLTCSLNNIEQCFTSPLSMTNGQSTKQNVPFKGTIPCLCGRTVAVFIMYSFIHWIGGLPLMRPEGWISWSTICIQVYSMWQSVGMWLLCPGMCKVHRFQFVASVQLWRGFMWEKDALGFAKGFSPHTGIWTEKRTHPWKVIKCP